MESKDRLHEHRSKKKMSKAEANDKTDPVDLTELSQLEGARSFVERFLGTTLPSPLECFDEMHLSYKKVNALLELFADAAEGVEGSVRGEAIEGWAVDATKLELEKMYVAAKRLFDICHRESRNGERAVGRR